MVSFHQCCFNLFRFPNLDGKVKLPTVATKPCKIGDSAPDLVALGN